VQTKDDTRPCEWLGQWLTQSRDGANPRNSTETREDSGKQPEMRKNCQKLTDSSYFQLEIGLLVLGSHEGTKHTKTMEHW
jgi:hypothetical protein